MVTHKAIADVGVLRTRKGFISENEKAAEFQPELRSGNRKGRHGIRESLASTHSPGQGSANFL